MNSVLLAFLLYLAAAMMLPRLLEVFLCVCELILEALIIVLPWVYRQIKRLILYCLEKATHARMLREYREKVRQKFGEEEARRFDADPEGWAREKFRQQQEEQERQRHEEKARQKRREQEKRRQHHSKSVNSYDQARRILGLPEQFTRKEFEKAYRRMMMKVHPDRGGSHDECLMVQKARKIIKVRFKV